MAALTSWHQFFSAEVGVGATLTGLVFVALSINLKHILEFPGLAGRAGEALLLLLLPVFAGLAGLLPQSGTTAFGAELLAIGLLECIIVTRIAFVGRRSSKDRSLPKFAVRVAGAEAAVGTAIAAGAILIASGPGGLWWQAASTALCVVAGVGDAWVLLIEILR